MADEKTPRTDERDQRAMEGDSRPLEAYLRGNGKGKTETEEQEKEKSPDEWSRHEVGHPERHFLLIAAVVLVLVLGAVLLFAWIPRHRREKEAAEIARLQREALPVVTAVKVRHAPNVSELMLPGNITAITEASIFARAAGYIRKRYVDIGDRVRQGQLLADIDAPELDQQVAQGRAALAQAEQQLSQAQAQLQQNRAQLALNKITRDRYAILVKRGALSRQDGDNQETAFQTQAAAVNSFEANVAAAEDNVRANRANLNRLIALQEFKNVRAPFTGVITARNFDLGALVSSTGGPQAGLLPLPGSAPNSSSGSGAGELFRESQIGVLRILINVPQTDATSIHVGLGADVTVAEYPGRRFAGKVTRTANEVDLSSRTLLTEVDVPNPEQLLLPGMYGQVQLHNNRITPPLLIPGDAVMADAMGLRVAVLDDLNPHERQQVQQRQQQLEKSETMEERQQLSREDRSPPRRLHLQQVRVGRDYGAEMEIISGLQGWEYIVVNPSDVVKEGAIVRATGQQATGSQQGGGATGGGAPGGHSPGGLTSATPGEANKSSSSGSGAGKNSSSGGASNNSVQQGENGGTGASSSSPGPAGSNTGKGSSLEPGTGTPQK